MARDAELIRFNALRNTLYHTARRRSFERSNRFFNFMVVVLGAAAIADVMTWIGLSQLVIGACVALIGALQLVLDFGGSARTHQTLQRAYYNLLADIEEAEEGKPELCRHWDASLIRIAADEPPTFRALDAIAYNDAVDALDWPRGERLVLKLKHQVFAQIWPFDGTEFRKVCEVEAEARSAGPSVQPAE